MLFLSCLIIVKYSSIWFNFWLIFWLIFCINFCIFFMMVVFFWAFAQFCFDSYVSLASLLSFRAILFESLLTRAHRGSLLVFFFACFLVMDEVCKLAHSSDIVLGLGLILKGVRVEFLPAIHVKKWSASAVVVMWSFWVAAPSSSDMDHGIDSSSLASSSLALFSLTSSSLTSSSTSLS